jgi:hypothetical protein
METIKCPNCGTTITLPLPPTGFVDVVSQRSRRPRPARPGGQHRPIHPAAARGLDASAQYRPGVLLPSDPTRLSTPHTRQHRGWLMLAPEADYRDFEQFNNAVLSWYAMMADDTPTSTRSMTPIMPGAIRRSASRRIKTLMTISKCSSPSPSGSRLTPTSRWSNTRPVSLKVDTFVQLISIAMKFCLTKHSNSHTWVYMTTFAIISPCLASLTFQISRKEPNLGLS